MSAANQRKPDLGLAMPQGQPATPQANPRPNLTVVKPQVASGGSTAAANRLGNMSQEAEDYSTHAPASTGRRFIALLLDNFLSVSISAVATMPMVMIMGQESAKSPLLMLVSNLLILVYWLVPTALFGQTLGKKIMGIKVVRMDGSDAIGFGATFMREVIGRFLSTVVLFAGYLVVMFREDKRAWHDNIAGTRVVSVR